MPKPRLDGLSDADLLVYLEAARVALADADTFDSLTESLDLSDAEMKRLAEQLTELMDGKF